MRLYIHMMLGGSICTLLYILFNHAGSCELPLKWRRAFLRVNMAVYLLPLPYLAAKGKEAFRYFLEKSGRAFLEKRRPGIIDTASVWESIFIMDEDGKLLYITGYQKWLPVVGIMAAIFLALTVSWLFLYLRTCRRYRRTAIFSARFSEEAGNEITKGHLRKRVRIGYSPCITTPLTVGIVRPVILLPEGMRPGIPKSSLADISCGLSSGVPAGGREYEASRESIICHELNHISGRDMAGRFFAFAVVAMGWFNPLAFYLLKEEMAVSEMLCDEAAVKGSTKKEKSDYIRCMIEAGACAKEAGMTAASFAASKSLLEERVKRLIGKHGKGLWRREAAAVIMAVCFAAGSIPALAYEMPGKYTVVREDSFGLDEGWKDVDMTTFISYEDIEKAYGEYRHRELLFMGDNGRLCCIDSFGMESENRDGEPCSHNYVPGILAQHVVNAYGSCIVATWEAEGCAGCGEVAATGRRLATAGSSRCIHVPKEAVTR